MEVLGEILFWLVLVVGVVVVGFGIPGTFVIASAALLYGLATGFERVPILLVVVLFVVAGLVELIEFFLSGYMAERYGGSRASFWGAIGGGILGAIWGTGVLPVFGTIVGGFIGAFAGAFAVEYLLRRNVEHSLLAGFGAFLGSVGGKMVKIISSIVMVVAIGYYYF